MYDTPADARVGRVAPPLAEENMTINRVQNIEKSIQELREVLDIRLTPVLMREASTAGGDAPKDSDSNRTYLESSLGNVEAAVDRVRSLIARLVI